MTTNRINHTACSHDKTPRGRAWCRDRRHDAVRTAQQAYMALWRGETPDGETYDNYHALVSDVTFVLRIEHDEAYEIVERGDILPPR